MNFGLYAFLGLRFPDGRLPTRRWRWVTWLGATVALMGAISVAFSPGPVYGLAPIRNPLGIEVLNNTVGLVEVLSLTLVLVAATSLLYGERDEPYKVLSRLGRRLEATLAPEAALTTIVETVSEA